MKMSSLTRWNPARDVFSMTEAMNRLFDEAFIMPRSGFTQNAMPSVDVVENDNEIFVKAELPGIKPEDVDIRVEGNLLSLRGEYKEEHENKEGEYYVKELRQGSFARTIPLPSTVDVNNADAQFENGILTLKLPKHEEAKPKRINITARNGSNQLNQNNDAAAGSSTNANQSDNATAGTR
jgi:HSP20 family protein